MMNRMDKLAVMPLFFSVFLIILVFAGKRYKSDMLRGFLLAGYGNPIISSLTIFIKGDMPKFQLIKVETTK